MPFAREPDGRISQRFFGAHTFRRTAFAGDYTGLEIQRILVHRAEQLQVPILDTIYITRLLVRDNVIFGAYGFDLGDGTRYLIHADAVILAAGGHTRIWRRTSSRRDENTGDAFRLAVEAGAASAIRSSCSSTRRASSNPRTPPARSSRRRRGARAASCATASASASWRATTPSAWSCRPATGSRSPPTPRSRRAAARPTAACGSTSPTCRARRSCGGSRASSRRSWNCRCSTSRRRRSRSRRPRTTRWAASGCAQDDGATGVEGLYAIGEASSGLHGANRLGGNSLVELLVYGRIAGRAAASHAAELAVQRRSPAAVSAARAEIDGLLAGDGPENVRSLQRAAARRDDRARGRRARRGGPGSRARASWTPSRSASRTSRCTPTTRASRTSPTRSTCGRPSSPRARPSRPRWSAGRRAGATTAPTIRTSTPPCRSTSSGRGPGRLVREQIAPIPDEIAALMREVSPAGKLLE